MFSLTSGIVCSVLAFFPGDDLSGFTKPVGQQTEAAASCFCQADIDHSGVVDGADLGYLLGAWNTPSADLNGSGLTDGADLGILLGDWGPCAAVPANDYCENATTIGEGTISFCTSGATTSGPVYPVGSPCIVFGYDSIDSDIWFTYTPSAWGSVKVKTCGTAWDTRLAIYANVFPGGQAQCPGPDIFTALITCNDDVPGCGGLSSEVDFGVIQGQEYLIRVGGYVGFGGQGTLHLEFTSEGQTCDGAIDMGNVRHTSLGIVGTTLDNDPATDDSPCGIGDTVPEWYKFRVDCPWPGPTPITVTTCYPYTDFDTVISVWSVGTGQCVGQFMGCNDDSSDTGCQIDGFNRKSTLTFIGDFDDSYYIRVSGYQGAKGDFNLVVHADCP